MLKPSLQRPDDIHTNKKNANQAFEAGNLSCWTERRALSVCSHLRPDNRAAWDHPPTSKAHKKEKSRDGPVSLFSQEEKYIVGKLQTVNLVTITNKLL